MSDVITIPTPFQDVGELAQGFVGRVNEDQLLLPSQDAMPEGETMQFVVLLADGTAAFGGQAQCVEVSDRGEDIPAEEPRYELLLEALEMEEASQAVFDHLIAIRDAAYQAQEEQAEPHEAVDMEEVDVDQAAEEPAYAEAQAGTVQEAEGREAFPQEAGTEEVYEDALHEVAEQPAEAMAEEATAEPGLEHVPEELEHVEELADSIQPEQAPEEIAPPEPLTRPVFQTTALPQPPPRPEPRPSSGLFVFQGEGLPVPPGPPRPQLDASLAVAPAPRPNGAAHASAAAAAPALETPEAPAERAEAAAEPAVQQAPQDVEDLGEAELMSVPPDAELSAAEEEAPADDTQEAEPIEEELQLDEDEPQQS